MRVGVLCRSVCRLAGVLLLIVLTSTRPAPVAAQNPQSGITSPAPGSSISGNVPIFGTAVIEPFQKYELHYKLEPSGDDAYIFFASDTVPVVDGQLGVWAADSLAPGIYSLRLRVVKTDGNYAEYYSPNLSVNQGPQPTPTPDVTQEPTPTPIPTATFTPAPQPTPVVGQVEQPVALEPEPTPTQAVAIAEAVQPAAGQPETVSGLETSSSVAEVQEPSVQSSSVTRELGEAVSFSNLRNDFMNGVRVSAAIMLSVTALYAGKKLFSWVWTQFS
jgi:hypothetical protein